MLFKPDLFELEWAVAGSNLGGTAGISSLGLPNSASIGVYCAYYFLLDSTIPSLLFIIESARNALDRLGLSSVVCGIPFLRWSVLELKIEDCEPVEVWCIKFNDRCLVSTPFNG